MHQILVSHGEKAMVPQPRYDPVRGGLEQGDMTDGREERSSDTSEREPEPCQRIVLLAPSRWTGENGQLGKWIENGQAGEQAARKSADTPRHRAPELLGDKGDADRREMSTLRVTTVRSPA